jgi:hypothetical protein
MWLYGSGFPKSLDISKAIDRSGGQPWSEFAGALKSLIARAGFNYTSFDEALAIPSAGSNSCYWVRTDERGGLPPRHYYERICELLNPEQSFRNLYDKSEREVIGIDRRNNSPSGIVSCGRNSVPVDRELTVPATDAAKVWDGYGTAMKPAYEPIILGMKPLDGTFAANALKHGVAGLNIDGSRINPGDVVPGGGPSYGKCPGVNEGWKRPSHQSYESKPSHDLGRWPANLILDEEVAAMLDEQAGELSSGAKDAIQSGWGSNGIYGSGKAHRKVSIADSGGASRFFYTAKADSNERGTGNNHPTVKPLDLMRYLCKLLCPPVGGILLEPFMGSGSTVIAGRMFFEKVVACEIEEKYCEIAAKRLSQEVLEFI